MRVQESSGNILNYIIQDMLDYAQIRSGNFRKNIVEFDVVQAMDEVMLILQRKAQDFDNRMYATFLNFKKDDYEDLLGDFSFKTDQIGVAHSCTVSTDRQRVMQIVLCLLSNALKFTQGGEVEILLQIISKQKAKFLEISVRDTGVGISEENQEKLFKFFGYLNETKEMNKSGVGLGLAIAQQITGQFNGKISVASKLGEGTTFTFQFELEQAKQEHNDKSSCEF